LQHTVDYTPAILAAANLLAANDDGLLGTDDSEGDVLLPEN